MPWAPAGIAAMNVWGQEVGQASALGHGRAAGWPGQGGGYGTGRRMGCQNRRCQAGQRQERGGSATLAQHCTRAKPPAPCSEKRAEKSAKQKEKAPQPAGGGGGQRAAYQMHAGEMWRGWGLGYVGWQFVSLSGRLCALELGRKARGKALGRPIQWRSRSGVHAAAARPNHHATAELAG